MTYWSIFSIGPGCFARRNDLQVASTNAAARHHRQNLRQRLPGLGQRKSGWNESREEIGV